MTTPKEGDRSQELMAHAESSVKFCQQVLEDISQAFEEHDIRRNDAEVIGRVKNILDILTRKGRTDIQIFRRKARPEDRLLEGEHPGSTLKITFNDDSVMHINLIGGIGREFYEGDMTDIDITLQRGHTQLTDRIEDSKTDMNFIIIDSSGTQVFSAGTRHIPGESFSVAYAYADNPDTGSRVGFSGFLSVNSYYEKGDEINEEQSTERYAYGRLAQGLEKVASAAVSLTPPPKRPV